MHKHFPERKVVDFLIRHFLEQVNWLYEEIEPQAFLQRYNAWWSQASQGEEDIQFGVLILRLCVNSLQFLPAHVNAPQVLRVSLDELEMFCNYSACLLDGFLPRKTSLLRIQQLLFYIPTLTNVGNSKEAYHTLGEAVKEAREIDLFLEDKWPPVSEYDRELRRRTFWNLYTWDR